MRFIVVALAFAAAVVTACAAHNETLRSMLAPDFGAATETQLQDGMWRLGHAVQDLDDVFKAEGVADNDRQAAVIETLDIMAAAAASVSKPGQKQSHTNVAMNIGKLVTDIEAAKVAALAHDYTLAKALPTSCLACHVGAGGGPQKPQ